MIRFIFTLLFPLSLMAIPLYETNYTKELEVLNAFDIDPSFLNDTKLMEIEEHYIQGNYHFFKTLKEASLYIPTIQNILAKNGVPQEFVYLAMAESNFKATSYSSKRASGVWQFMPQTACVFHLKIDDYIDERCDLVKSTQAAATYLKKLHKKFHKWYLAAIAYNCGRGCLIRAIDKAQSDELSVLLDEEQKFLPPESRNYIRKIVAIALIATNEQYLINNECEYLLNRSHSDQIAVVQLPGGASLRKIAHLINIEPQKLQELNPQLKYDFIPPYSGKFNLYIPYETLATFKQKYKKSAVKRDLYRVHIVTQGDNLSYIGKKYGVAYGIIKEVNHLQSNSLKIGQKLLIPMAHKGKLQQHFIHKTQQEYIVRSGDTLESIAKAHHTSIKKLKRLNHIQGSLIRVGERLQLHD